MKQQLQNTHPNLKFHLQYRLGRVNELGGLQSEDKIKRRMTDPLNTTDTPREDLRLQEQNKIPIKKFAR